MAENIKDFYDLNAWKKSHGFVLEVYKITKKFPKEELYGVTSQLRRASASIAANIAEGFSRYHYNDKERFYHNARGSVNEAQNFLLMVKDLSFLNKEEFQELFGMCKEIGRLINGLVRSIENQK